MVVHIDCEEHQALPAPVEDSLLRWIEMHLPDAEACLISDYGKGAVSARVAQHVIVLARQASKPVVVDPKGADYAKYRGATVIKPNVHELERFLKEEIDDDEELVEAGRRLVAFLGGTAVLVTRGPTGLALFRDLARAPVHVKATARKVFDVTGAGDTVVGVLALGLAAGADLEVATRLANQAAGLCVEKRGAATITPDELRAEPGVAEV